MTRSHARFLLHADAALALLSGLMCVVTPQLFAGSFFTVPLTAPGLCFVRLLGTMYVYYALMEWCVLARGDRRFWAVFLLACLAGDLAHVAVFLLGLCLPDAYWGSGAWANVAIVAFFFSVRIYLLRNLHLTDRAGPADMESSAAATLPAPEVAA